MIDWLQTLLRLRQAAEPAILVTVAEVRGSTPREAGARMVVSRSAAVGTIGGGHLEWQAIAIARDQLAGAAIAGLRRFALGASLGQCCGGAVTLWFEPVCPDPALSGWIDIALARLAVGQTVVLESVAGTDGRAGRQLRDDLAAARPDGFASGQSLASRLVRDRDGVAPDRLLDMLRPDAFTIAVFGAGHVGQALVAILAHSGARLIWVDGRAEMSMPAVAVLVERRCGDDPVAEVRSLPAGCYCIVLTHDHALDEALALAILQRDDLGWFGMIGSQTKRRRFEHRLGGRGIDDSRLARMVCPIGMPGIVGKAPGVVAIAIAAQVMTQRSLQTARSQADPGVAPAPDIDEVRRRSFRDATGTR